MGGARTSSRLRSTYPNIGVPRVYADHALACKTEGYVAYKIHPHYFWNLRAASRRLGGRRTSRPTSRRSTWCAMRSGLITC